MKVKFDLNLSAWLRNIEIEANSYEEAKQEIYKMPLEELLELCYIDTTHINDLTAEIVEKEYQVKVYDIEYRFENNDLEPEEVHKLRNRMPSTLTLNVLVDSADDLESRIADEIYYETDELVDDFKYIIIHEE